MAFWVQIYTPSGVKTARITGADHHIIEAGPLLPLEPMPTDSAAQEQSRQQFKGEYAREQQQNNPKTLGDARLYDDGSGNNLLETPEGPRRVYALRANCPENPDTKASFRGYYFFLDENHICIIDCSKFRVISASGEVEYSLPLHYITAKITRGKTLFATLEPARTFWGHLIPGPEDSSRLQVFCSSTGKRRVSGNWPAAYWNTLVLSTDERTVALLGRSAARFYRLQPESCPK